MGIFSSEREMQAWLSKQLKASEGLNQLIANIKEIEDLLSSDYVERRILDSYHECISALDLTHIFSENENISLKSGEILSPDFLLYSLEAQRMVIVELKNLKGPSREAGTELSAYSAELKSYIPFIAEGDIIHVIISSEWTTLLKHYAINEILWGQKNLLCLQPINFKGSIKLQILSPSELNQQGIPKKLSYKQIGGYQICLYDPLAYSNSQTDFSPLIHQMKTAIEAIASYASARRSHGFAMLWKDVGNKLAPYSIAIMNVAPFQSIERFFHEEGFKPNEITERFIKIIAEFYPMGHSATLDAASRIGKEYLSPICSPRQEGYFTWDLHLTEMKNRAMPISFRGWGIFNDLISNLVKEEYKKGNSEARYDDPKIGLTAIDKLIDPNYQFIELSNYFWSPENGSIT